MILSDAEKASLQKRFEQLMKDDITLVVFADDSAVVSKEVVEFAKTLSSLSPKIKLQVEKVEDGKNPRMREFKVEHEPVIILQKGDFTRIHYYGAPSGFETPPILDAVVELSNSKTPLSPKSISIVQTIRRKANIKIFVLTTCTFCPIVARHAYRASIESPRITAEIIDSQMFPDLAARHSVMGVPKIILNDNLDITGAIQEVEFFEKLKDSDISQIDSIYG